jgi:hypothetical protein
MVGSSARMYLRWALQLAVVLVVGPLLTYRVWPSAPIWAVLPGGHRRLAGGGLGPGAPLAVIRPVRPMSPTGGVA